MTNNYCASIFLIKYYIYIIFIVVPTTVPQHKTTPTNIFSFVNPLNAELNPICYLLVLLGAHHFLHVSRIRVNIILINIKGC